MQRPRKIWCGIVLRVREDACEIVGDASVHTVGYANQIPTPHVERVAPGHLVAVTSASDGSDVVVWRWYDAVVLAHRDDVITLWEPAHGEVLGRLRPGRELPRVGTRAYSSAGLPGADWWVAGRVADGAAVAELDAVERLYTEYGGWGDLV